MTLSSGSIGILALHFIPECKSLRQISSLVILNRFAGPVTTSGGGLSTSCWTSPALFNGFRISPLPDGNQTLVLDARGHSIRMNG
jgi:hypothetical protein